MRIAGDQFVTREEFTEANEKISKLKKMFNVLLGISVVELVIIATILFNLK